MSWMDISKHLSVCRTTLYKYKKLIPDEITLSDNELIERIGELRANNPHFGEVYIKAALLAEGFIVTRARIRACIRLIDPEGAVGRRRPRIERGSYYVPGPMFMWHLDGNEKLQPFKIYLHGCIDGYSRKIMYLQCASSKKAVIPMKMFCDAVHEFGLPHCIRCDRGGENVDIIEFMNSNLGMHHTCVLQGRSVHNVRIERLWREVNQVTYPFKQLFYRMEQSGMLVVGNDIHVLALHYVYLPRIQQKLDQFVRVWDSHKIRTGGYKTPNEMFVAGNRAPIYNLNFLPVDLSDDDMREILDFEATIVPDPLQDDGNDGCLLFLNLKDALTAEFQTQGLI